MPELALAVYALFGAVAFGLRVLLQWRATGSTGVHGLGGRPGSAEWLAGVLFLAAIVLAVAAPVLALADVVAPIAALDREVVNVAGLVIALAGIGATLAAQVAMGASWRIGVEPDERTELVTTGPFAVVRNPIYAAIIPTGLGLTLMVPSAVALVALAALVVAFELQVRVVEEPHLLRVHGRAYGDYAARVGRFVPGVGLLGPR